MHVVFLRAANVGGHNPMKPASVAKALAELDVKNVGAAGTFLVRSGASATTVKAAFVAKVPAGADVIVRPAKELVALAKSDPFGRAPADVQRFVTVLAAKPKEVPSLPLERPQDRPWQLRLVRVAGRYALCLRRPEPGRFYPNDIVEKALGVRGTTRGWATIGSVLKLVVAR